MFKIKILTLYYSQNTFVHKLKGKPRAKCGVLEIT